VTVLARTFHGLTLRRLAVPGLFGLVLCAFDWPVAVTYARGLPESEVVKAFVQTYASTALSFYAGLLAGVVAYNGVRGSAAMRVVATVLAVGLAVWFVSPLSVLVRNAPWRDVYVGEDMPGTIMWLINVGPAGLAVAAILYMTRGDDAARALESEARRGLDLARAHDEARLQAMQAQIEPHFLFNTLANVRRLYEVDCEAARTMLRQFVGMLAQTLPDIRTQRSTLGREVALSLAYLNVQKIRMGERLTIVTDIPPSLRDASLPPMMLSTLVENAIKHGLAPLPQGGRIVVSARADGSVLHVEVADTGRGLDESVGNGVGLANIETRLAVLYGSMGQLGLEPNEQGGVTACLRVPLTMALEEAPDAA
jgi:signal transduction histidine kinase